jgi:hypothetical protein
MRPLRIGEVAWIAQLVAVVAVAVFGRPHRAPRQKGATQRITANRAASSANRGRP